MTSDKDWDGLITRLSASVMPRDSVASEEDWRELRRRVRRLARIVAFNTPRAIVDVDDLVQDTMVKLLARSVLARLQQAKSKEGYIVVMLRHALIDRVRAQARQAGAVELAPDTMRLDDLVALRDVVRRLTPDERELLRLRFWAGLSIGQMADRLDVPYSTVSVRLFRLIQKLRAQLQ